MDKNTIHYTHLIDLIKNDSIKNHIKEFSQLNKWYFEIVQSLFESKSNIKYFQTELEGKYIRFGFANQSIIDICGGFDINVRKKSIKRIDIFSIYSICRMQFESYIMMHYLFFDKITETEKEFRYIVYKLHGMIKQSKFPTLFEESKNFKSKIEQDIKHFRDELKNKKYNEFLHFVKDPFNPKKAKYIDTEQGFKIAKLNSGRLDKYWNVLSNHVHSEYIGDRQYNTYMQNRKEYEAAISLSTEVCMILTSKLILKLKKEFIGVELYFNTIPDKIQAYINTWDFIGNKI